VPALEGTKNAARGTRRVLIVITALALSWGVAFRVRTLLALGIAQSSLLLVLALYPRLAARRLGVVRHMPARAFEEEEVSVRFGLENRGSLPFVFAEVEDCFAPDQDIFRRAPLPPVVGPRTRAVGLYRASCFGKRGAYSIGPARLRIADPFGLFVRDVVLDEPTPFVVYPRTAELPALPPGGSGRPLGATALARKAGQSAEALSVREYRPGDPLRRIHWPTTARRGKLAVLELELEQARDVAIFIDLDRRTLRGLGRRSTLEHSVRIAAAAAATYLARGDRVRLLAQGKQPAFAPPGAGERHLALVLDELARVRPDGEETIESLVARSAGELHPGSTAFIVLATADDSGTREKRDLLTRERTAMIAALRARGCEVVCVLLDEPTFLPIYREQQRGPGQRTAVPRVADALVREGALVYVVAQGDDLAERFLHPFRGPRRG
jgi:uncharacterized protein (DUF58 family)